jgi:MFS family permease
VPLIYLVTSVMAATSAFDNPARQSIIPSLVPPKHLVNAISLNTLTFQIATITGPALAALTISRLDIGLVYLIDFLTFLVTIGTLLAMRLEHKVGNSRRPGGWQAIAEGFRFVHSSRLIWSTMLLDFMATFFSSTRTLLPIIANDLLGVGVSGYGVLATAQPLGSLLAGLILSMTREMRHQGPVLLGSVLVFGLATALFGLSQVFALSYVFFALTGAADTVSAVIRNTIRQLMTPDEMRGRMVGVNSIFFAGGPQLGDLEAGLVAALAGAPFAIVSGGVATVIFTIWIAWKYPRLRNYTQQPAAEEQNEGKRTED